MPNSWSQPDFEPRIRVAAIAHITGGGMPSKFGEDLLFPRGFSAEISGLNVPYIMQWAANELDLPPKQCYEKWHSGPGVLAVIDHDDRDRFIAAAMQYGISARWCGTIRKAEREPAIIIYSGYSHKGRRLGEPLEWRA